MSVQVGWSNILDEIIKILKSAEHYPETNETCFLTAYQLAVLLYENNKALIQSANCPKNIGGMGEKDQNSLSQYIARNLSQYSKKENSDIELRFLNITGLEQFSFLDEKKILSMPSKNCFSMFRYIG